MIDRFDNIYDDLPEVCHPFCEGCSNLKKDKADHGIIDYENVKEVDVLFLTDSFVTRQGRFYPTRADTEAMLSRFMSGLKKHVTWAMSPAIKCPTTKDSDLKPKDKEQCRQHLSETLKAFNPKLVFCLGNVPLVMLLKKSGVNNKRGNIYPVTVDEVTYPVMPTIHPFQVVKEPKNKSLFEQDIFNGIDRYIYGNVTEVDFDYIYMDTVDKVESMWEELVTTTEDLSCDLETEGLDFRNHKILTLAISTDNNNWVLPCYHKYSPYNDEVVDRLLRMYIKPVLENPNNRKVFHNAKFDIKFLLRHNISPVNVWDTKLMSHLYNENMPKSLMDLVKRYYPTELEQF